MKNVYIIIILWFIFVSGCATTNRSTNESMLNFLPYLNQKVAGYISENNIKTLNTGTYNEIVKAVCSPLPSCSKNAEILLNTYTVEAHSLNDRFSVLLCDKERNIKAMEDFSCNEQIVEIRNFEMDPKAQCEFETNWEEKIRPYCPIQ